ncbi:hypothetical protein Vretimale_8077 [Volvox reticuliferus]|uniref:Transcription factor IIIC subunit 5 HTH domain-containing protein n=2 Tax=Volvox reticuliferus TaxID=1737510 RepID=A0A8J4LNV7_9CHLO|nr:hypothetical protein Vretifemale_5228 [Volvox reticuliferus]GIM03327.1 hypothetical protein Vretimale_8077 [Volvox reticuliferus]
MSLAEIHIEIPKAEAVAIEYPGFVRDINKVLSTLGGIDSIATAVGTRHYLKLKLRPEDRSSHPLYGERIEQTRLLLRIARPRQPCDGQSTNTATSSAGVFTGNEAEPMEATSATGGAGDTAGVTASIVARVTPTFRFPGLADYAFIPHDPVLASRTREHLPYDQRPDRAEPTKSMQPFLLIPQLFSWLDLPQDYSFKQVQTKHHLRANARSEPSWGEAPVISFYAEGVPPPVASTSVGAAAAAAAAASAATTAKPTTVGANDAAGSPVPVATMAQADASIADVRAYRVLEAEVSRLLAQRPVWGLDLMRERCAACAAVQAAMPGGCNSGAVERVVQRLCYRFKTGPWRGLFIRRGYDPRADVEARKYQALVYSLPNNWYRNMLKTGLHGGMKQQGKTATAERGPSDGGGAGEAGSAAAGATGVLNSGHNSPGVGASASPGAGGGDSREGAGGFAAAKATTATTTWSPLAPSCLDDLHKFRALPTQQSVTFQLVDLQLTEVQEALQEGPPSADASRCSEKTGWFVNAMLQRMQAAVQQRFLQLMERMAPPGVGLGVTGDLPSSGGMEAAAAAAAGGGGAPNTRVAGAAGAGRRGGEAATAGQTSAAAASDGGDGDVEMLDATAAEETRAVQQGFDGAAAAAAATRCR